MLFLRWLAERRLGSPVESGGRGKRFPAFFSPGFGWKRLRL